MAKIDPFGSHATLATRGGSVRYYRIDALARAGHGDVDRLPYTVRILLENVLRHHAAGLAADKDILALGSWDPDHLASGELPFLPARVVLQDFTGVPAIVDLAAMRSAVARLGRDPERINPLVPADLVIDHSVQVDVFGTPQAYAANVTENRRRSYMAGCWFLILFAFPFYALLETRRTEGRRRMAAQSSLLPTSNLRPRFR